MDPPRRLHGKSNEMAYRPWRLEEMSESVTHKQCADELHEYLWRKTNGCVFCKPGDSHSDHEASYSIRRNLPGLLNQQQVIWPCDDHNFHYTDILLGVGRVVRDSRHIAPSGTFCKSDVVVLDTHDQPLFFLEMVYKNRHNKVPLVAEELGIPVFYFSAYKERTRQAHLVNSRRWWELSDMPEADKRQRVYMETVGEELQRSFNGEETARHLWAMDSVVKPDGTVFNTLRHSGMDVSPGAFPNAAGLIFADCSSLSCSEAIKLQDAQNEWDQLENDRDRLLDLQRSIGSEVLDTIRMATKRSHFFAEWKEHITPLGDVQLRLKARLEELSQDPNDPLALRLMEHMRIAEQKVSKRQEWRNI